jgi:flagellar M-ring protein FliF
MAEALARVFDSGPAAWTGLGRGRQVLLLGLAVLLAVALFLGSQWMGDTPYVPLFASLPAEDAGAIVTQLKASKTPYRVGAGDQILVPADKVNEIRLRVASQGLPLGSGVGFEVFDKGSFGLSDFNQRINYQRALQGELARTIGQLRGVTRARVHLVMPQPSLFAQRERAPSASVFLKLAPGTRLTNEDVRGIIHLVASSVEGLVPARVTVVDTAGRMLAAGTEPVGTGGDLSPKRVEIKAAVEDGIERRVQGLLDSALGPGQAMTRVSSQLNFDQVERTEERFDPGPVTKQETRTVEKTKASALAPMIAAGTPVPGAAPPQQHTTTNEGTRESATVSYELSRIVARTLTSPGEIQRLSVAVLVNTATRVKEGPDKKDVRESVPRSAEELEKIKRLVMGAAGYNQARGDEVTVVEMTFDTTVRDHEQALLEQQEVAPAKPPAPWWLAKPVVLGAAGSVVGLALVMGLWLFMRRRKRGRALADLTRAVPVDRARGATPAERLVAESEGAADDTAALPGVPEEFLRISREREDIRQKAVGLATAEPEVAAQLIRAWMMRRRGLAPAGGGRDGG